MFLRLPAVIAGGRALGALAFVLASMSGHAAMGHHHLDVPRAAFAFLLLLAASWRTNDVRWLLVAGQLSQVVVHGGVAASTWPMLLMHTSLGGAAALLVWRFESVWAACSSLLAPLLRAFAVAATSLRVPRRLLPALPRGSAPTFLDRFTASLCGRGPPVLA